MRLSSLIIKNSRPGVRPHWRHLAGVVSFRNHIRIRRNMVSITILLAPPKHVTCQKSKCNSGGCTQLSDEIDISPWELVIMDVVWLYPSQISNIERLSVS